MSTLLNKLTAPRWPARNQHPYDFRTVRRALEMRASETPALSFAAIGKEIGKDASTVARWLRRYLNDPEFRKEVDRAPI
ncbi:MAG: helix-turn-helix domain-containing protein [Caldilineaceae bacterium]|nr:helix-turn-helix domain-containing protein [Caldilineaceae bacterium]MDE0196711.1 helix-turn-helix domain-containing protein [Caldilineaceae bacterium]